MAYRTLVQLEDKLLEVKENDKGKLAAKFVSDDELAEITLLDEGVQKMLENDVNDLANQAYKELCQDFKDTLKCNVLNIVGFKRDSWHKDSWEVDHCNGRNSQLTEYMSDKVKKLFHDEFDKLIQSEVAELVKPLKKALNQEFKEYFYREVRSKTQEYATVAAKDFLDNLLKREVKRYQKVAIEKAGAAFHGRKQAVKTNEEDLELED